MTSQIGCNVNLDFAPNSNLDVDRLLFSESHSRYLLVSEKKNIPQIENILKSNKTAFKKIGDFAGKTIQFTTGSESIVTLDVDKTNKTWLESLSNLLLYGKQS